MGIYYNFNSDWLGEFILSRLKKQNNGYIRLIWHYLCKVLFTRELLQLADIIVTKLQLQSTG